MTEDRRYDALVEAASRDRRRWLIVTSLVSAVLLGTLGTGWVLSAMARASWVDQATMWQDRYVELYDEFTAATGDDPEAPEPGEVVDEPIVGEQGAPGPIGPRGPRGEDGEDGSDSTVPGPQGLPGAPGADSTVPGPQGPAGEDGQDGKDGADSTVPGPAGSDGTPGVGISSITCLEDGTWQFVLTDGTIQSVPGPCRVVAPIEEVPE